MGGGEWGGGGGFQGEMRLHFFSQNIWLSLTYHLSGDEGRQEDII